MNEINGLFLIVNNVSYKWLAVLKDTRARTFYIQTPEKF